MIYKNYMKFKFHCPEIHFIGTHPGSFIYVLSMAKMAELSSYDTDHMALKA